VPQAQKEIAHHVSGGKIGDATQSPLQWTASIVHHSATIAALMHLDLSFADGYEISILNELPNTSVTRHFFPPKDWGGYDGILVSVAPTGESAWLGQFAFGTFRPGVCAVFTLPEPEHIAVVARGPGYVVHTRNPNQWEEVEAQPIRQVRVLRHERLVLFADWTRITAYGDTGLAWISERLCWDDLSMVTVEQQTLVGTGSDPTDPTHLAKQFRLDVRTGRVLKTEFTNLQ
jgi:hypothetical protein